MCVYILCVDLYSQRQVIHLYTQIMSKWNMERGWYIIDTSRTAASQSIVNGLIQQHNTFDMKTQLWGTIKSGTKSEYDCQSQVFSPNKRWLLSWCLRGRPLPMKLIHEHIWSAPLRWISATHISKSIFFRSQLQKQTPGGKILKSSNIAFRSCIFF